MILGIIGFGLNVVAASQPLANITLATNPPTVGSIHNSTYFDGSWTGGVAPYTISLYSGSALSNPHSASAANCSSYPIFVSSNLYTSQSFSNWVVVNTSSPSRAYICYKIVDSAGHSAYSPVLSTAINLSAFPLSNLVLYPTVQSIIPGADANFTAFWNGGKSPYSFALYSGKADSCSNNNPNFTVVSSNGGTLLGTSVGITINPISSGYYCLVVGDSTGYDIHSSAVYVQAIGLAPTNLIFTTTTPSVTNRTSARFLASWTSGTPPYGISVLYSGQQVCPSQGMPSIFNKEVVSGTSIGINATPTSSGYYCLFVTDNSGYGEYSNSTYITVTTNATKFNGLYNLTLTVTKLNSTFVNISATWGDKGNGIQGSAFKAYNLTWWYSSASSTCLQGNHTSMGSASGSFIGLGTAKEGINTNAMPGHGKTMYVCYEVTDTLNNYSATSPVVAINNLTPVAPIKIVTPSGIPYSSVLANAYISQSQAAQLFAKYKGTYIDPLGYNVTGYGYNVTSGLRIGGSDIGAELESDGINVNAGVSMAILSPSRIPEPGGSNSLALESVALTNQAQQAYFNVTASISKSYIVAQGTENGATYSLFNAQGTIFMAAWIGNRFAVAVSDVPINTAQLTNIVTMDLANNTSTGASSTTISSTAPEYTVQVSKGWNIVPIYGVTEDSLGSCQPNVATLTNSIFLYNSTTGRYTTLTGAFWYNAGSSPSADPYINGYSGWFYSPVNCELQYSLADTLVNNNPPTQLTSGWNFFTVMPWMLNQSYSSVFSGCNVKEVYSYSNNGWIGGESSVMAHLGTQTATSTEVGDSMIIKVASACQLQTQQLSPPAPPSSAH